MGIAIISAKSVPLHKTATPSLLEMARSVCHVPRKGAGGSHAGPQAEGGRAGLTVRTHSGPHPAKFHFSRRVDAGGVVLAAVRWTAEEALVAACACIRVCE